MEVDTVQNDLKMAILTVTWKITNRIDSHLFKVYKYFGNQAEVQKWIKN